MSLTLCWYRDLPKFDVEASVDLKVAWMTGSTLWWRRFLAKSENYPGKERKKAGKQTLLRGERKNFVAFFIAI